MSQLASYRQQTEYVSWRVSNLFYVAMSWQTFDLYHAKDNKLVFGGFQAWMWCMVPLFLYAMERLIRGVRSFQKVEIIKVRLSNRNLQKHYVMTWALIGKTPMVYFAGKPYLSFAITFRTMKVKRRHISITSLKTIFPRKTPS